MPTEKTPRQEADVDSDQAPISWVGEDVRLEIRDALDPRPGVSSSSPFDTRHGQLVQVNELGVTLETASGVRFYPWSSVRQLTLVPT
jgi:hypothetical protein